MSVSAGVIFDDANDSLPDEVSVAAQIQLAARVSIALSENKTIKDKKEINLQVTAVPKTEFEDIQIKLAGTPMTP